MHGLNPRLSNLHHAGNKDLRNAKRPVSGRRLILSLLCSTASKQTKDSWRQRMIFAHNPIRRPSSKTFAPASPTFQLSSIRREYPVVFKIRMIPASCSLTAWSCGLVRRFFGKWLTHATSACLDISDFFRFWLFLFEGMRLPKKWAQLDF